MKKYIYILIILIYSTKPSNAELIQISAEKAYNLSVQNNSQIQLLEKDIQIAQNNISLFSKPQNPQLMGNFFVGPVFNGNDNQVGILFPLEFRKIIYKRKIAKIDYENLRLKLIFEKRNIKKNVHINYIKLLLAKTELNEQKQYLNFLENNKNRLNDFFFETEEERQKQIINLLQMEVSKQHSDFNQNIHGSAEKKYDTVENSVFENEAVFNPKIFDIEDKYLLLQNDIKRNEAVYKLEKINRIPTPLVGGGFAFQISEYDDEYTYGGFITFNVELPIFDTNSERIKNSKIALDKSKLILKEKQNSDLLNYQTSYGNYLISKTKMYDSKELLQKIKQKLDNQKDNITFEQAFIYRSLHNEYIQSTKTFVENYFQLINL